MSEAAISPTTWQAVCLSVPEEFNLFLGGGRGGGKTYCEVLLALRHVEQHGESARVLIVRATHKALTELWDEFEALLQKCYPGTKSNRAERIFRLANGGQVELGELTSPGSYPKYQGRSFTLLIVDDAGTMPPVILKRAMLLKSNLRGPAGVPLRTIVSANPGGVSHAYIHQRYVARAPAFHPFELDGERWVCCPSTLDDNPHLDREAYRRQLRAACGDDEELLKAWETGDWNVNRGSFFAGSLNESVHMLPATFQHRVDWRWAPFIAGDWGSSSPSVVYMVLRAPGGIGPWAKDSVLLVDELATADPNDLSVGLQWPPGMLAEAVREMCGRWDCHPTGVMDDFVGLSDTLIGVFREHHVYVRRPRKKDRVGGWAKMREMLHNAKEKNGRPGLYISERCKYFWQTVPFIPRDELRPEDLNTRSSLDHAADAARYAVLHAHAQRPVGNGFTTGWY
jgi:hypothetical protein